MAWTIRSPQSSTFIATIFAVPTAGHSPQLLPECLSNFVDMVNSILSGNISLSSRSLDGSSRVAEYIITSTDSFPLEQLRRHSALEEFEAKHGVNVAWQINDAFRRHKRLAVFDMDSTLIQQEVIDEIARKLGVEDRVSTITERAMNGELDFTASLRERCALLRGASSNVFEEIKQVITLSPGAADLIRALKKLGYKTAVISGGFLPLTCWQAEQLGLDYAHANHLATSDDGQTLTGELTGEIIHAQKKAELVASIAAKNGFSLDQVFCVGDGANDLPMMWTAGVGIAFNAKPNVQKEAPVRINGDSLLDILYLLGFSTTEQTQLIST